MINGFFIHDEAIKAITFLHPNLKHGSDYLVLMGLEENRKWIPASDAWIEWWDAEEVQPTIEYLKQVFIDNDLANWNLVTQQPQTQGTQDL
jgi:hypothetical protein